MTRSAECHSSRSLFGACPALLSLLLAGALLGGCPTSGAAPGGSDGGQTPSGPATDSTTGRGDGRSPQGSGSGVSTPEPGGAGAGGAPDPGSAPPACRSRLYPQDWTLGLDDGAGHSLPDFSYAGYHHGDDPIPNVTGPVFEAKSYGADATGKTNACPAIQAALDAAARAGGGVVHLAAGTYRCQIGGGNSAVQIDAGRLWLHGDHTVLRGDGPQRTFLYFAHVAPRSPYWDIAVSPDNAISGEYHFNRTAMVPLVRDALPETTTVNVASLCSSAGQCLQVGDDVALGFGVTDAFLRDHDALSPQGGVTAYNQVAHQSWTPVHYRSIVSVDTIAGGHRIHLDAPVHMPALVRDHAMLHRESNYLAEVGVEELSVSNTTAWAAAFSTDLRFAIGLGHVKNAWIRNVHSFASPWSAVDSPARGRHLQSGGIQIGACKEITVQGCDFELAENRGGGGNGYLYHLSLSNEVLVRDTVGHAGRHNFTVGGTGLANNGNVFLRVETSDGAGQNGPGAPLYAAYSDFHNYLATANLIDSSQLLDGWIAPHADGEFGHTGTQGVFWNDQGGGMIASYQFHYGYVIGLNDLEVHTALNDPITTSLGYLSPGRQGNYPPPDYTECPGGPVAPASLYEDQLARRKGN